MRHGLVQEGDHVVGKPDGDLDAHAARLPPRIPEWDSNVLVRDYLRRAPYWVAPDLFRATPGTPTIKVYFCYLVDMKTISVAELRQNPTQALNEVEHGETYVVTRHRREIGRLVPPVERRRVSPSKFEEVLRQTPVDMSWGRELDDSRIDFDLASDPWIDPRR